MFKGSLRKASKYSILTTFISRWSSILEAAVDDENIFPLPTTDRYLKMFRRLFKEENGDTMRKLFLFK